MNSMLSSCELSLRITIYLLLITTHFSGAGGAGLRAAFGLAEAGFKTACITNSSPPEVTLWLLREVLMLLSA